jgi:3-deoxy-D-manno-octulosonic-acid transferase
MSRWSVYLIYNLMMPVVLLVSLPGYVMRMLRRGNYRSHFMQRFGRYKPEVAAQLEATQSPCWIHAVSVGEVLIALKLVREMRRREPGLDVVLSTTTSTGFALANEKSGDAGDGAPLVVIYNPVDFRSIVRRVMQRVDPRLLVLVEAEVWPNLVARAKKNGVPISLVNARLSDRSERRYRKVTGLVRPVFSQLDRALVQDERDIDRIAMLGVPRERIRCVGSVKFDPQDGAEPTAQVADFKALLAESFGGRLEGRKILLGGSTHDGEEALLGNAYREVRERHPEIFYIVVPRHFERAAAVKAQLEADGLFPALRSELGTPVSDATDCVIVDTTGELRAWYYLADVVVIGKSFISTGGQNPVEALLAGKPVLFGPHMENFRALVESLNTAGGTRQVADIAELREVVLGLLDEPESGAEMVAQAREVLAQHDGATARTSEILLGD